MNFSQITNKLSRRVGLGLLFMGLVGGATVPYYYDFFMKASEPSTSQVAVPLLSQPQPSKVVTVAPIVEQTNTVINKGLVQNKQVANNTPLPNTTDIVDARNGDPWAAERAAWEKMVNEHKYSNRPAYNKKDWKRLGLKRADRPDWAFEQDFLRTMNPSTGEVPLQAKDIANQYAKEYWERPQVQAAIPITWTERGPNNIGGRTRAVMFDPNDATKKKVWAGGAGGGLWFTNDITTNAGWTKVDDLWDNIAISCIAYDPSNTQIFYVGTGEAYGGGVRGAGIWRTTNGGTTWTRMAGTDPTADDFNYVQKIVVRANGEVLATTRGLFTNTGGLMKFNGTSWTKVLAPMTGTGLAAADGDMLRDWGCDVEIAANGDIYASMGFDTFGKVYKSTEALTVTPVNATPTLDALTNLSVAVSAPTQTVNLTGISMGTGDTGQTLTVTATSSNLAVIPNPTVTYTSPNATGSISFTPVANQSGTVTITVTVTDNGGTACGAVNTISRTFVVDVGTPTPPPPPARRSQTITFDAIADREFTNVPFGVLATASSNLPVTITVTSGNASINGQTLTLTGIGDITLTATQAGNNEFLAATPVSRTFKVIKATPSINFAAITDRAWNSGSFGISVSGTTGQPTVAVTQGQTIATLVNNNTVNLNAAVGQVTITASLAETPTYNAVSVSRSFAVTKANQQINFPSLFVLRAGTTETLQAAASSNLPVTYTVVSGNATVTGNTLNVTNAAAPIVVSASQAGNDLWNAATTVTQTIQVLKVEQTVSLNASVSPTISLGQSQTVNVTSSSNLPITIRVITGTATINGLTITPTSTGLVVIEIIQLGNDVFNASQPIRLAFNVLPTITLSNVNVAGTVCAGAELTVGYTTNGNFAAGNYFILELSDEEGNFNGSSLGGQEGVGAGSFKLPIPRSLNRTSSRYRVRVVAYPSGVISNSSNAFTINTLPAQPFITLNTDGKTLSSTSATGNQWYLAGIPIASATGQTFTPTQTGSYTLIVTQNGCASIESPAYFYQLPTPTGINDDNLAAGLSLFPNPTENKFVLEGTVEKAGVVTLKLADALGRILNEEKVSTNGVQLKAEINLSDYGAGVYFLTIESNGKTAIKRIVRH